MCGSISLIAVRFVWRRIPDVAKRLLDLAGIAEAQLYSLGAGRVMQSGLCNYQNPDFYSYRRSCQQALKVGPVPHTGRMASVVMLNKGA